MATERVGEAEDDRAFKEMLQEANLELQRGYEESREQLGLSDKRTFQLSLIPPPHADD
jgi:hypothetical protein